MDKATGFQLNRKKYQAIKRFDHNQMTNFLADIYKNGYADGKKSAEGLNIDEVRDAVLSIKGIGEKKADAIIEALESCVKAKETIEKNKKAC